MTRHAGAEDNPTKFREMFSRRLVKGQQHYQPYLGCREFPAIVAGDEATPPARDETRSLGLMLHDIDFGLRNEARFFDAKLEHGILRVPEWSAA
jgi:CRISPR-associated protein Cas5d